MADSGTSTRDALFLRGNARDLVFSYSLLLAVLFLKSEVLASCSGVLAKMNKVESFSTGMGSKLKPCTKFFSNSGSPFSGNPAHPPAGRNPVGPPSFQDGASPPVKSCLCNKYNSAEGCKFGDKCNFAHGEWELGRPTLPSYDDPRAMGPLPGRYCGSRIEPSPPGLGAAASFGASAPAKISVDA